MHLLWCVSLVSIPSSVTSKLAYLRYHFAEYINKYLNWTPKQSPIDFYQHFQSDHITQSLFLFLGKFLCDPWTNAQKLNQILVSSLNLSFFSLNFLPKRHLLEVFLRCVDSNMIVMLTVIIRISKDISTKTYIGRNAKSKLCRLSFDSIYHKREILRWWP